MCQYARLLDGEKVGVAVDKMVAQAADSFFNGRRIFQIGRRSEAGKSMK